MPYSSTLCTFCKKVELVNWPGTDWGMPVCRRCQEAHDAQYTLTRVEQFVVGVLLTRADHRHINTRGFDPYAGERWTFKFGKLTVETDTVICITVTVKFGHRVLYEVREYDYRGIRKHPLARFAMYVSDILQKALDISYAEDQGDYEGYYA